jgi:hypothetical protein
MAVAGTIAYHDTATITAVKCFVLQVPREKKTFVSDTPRYQKKKNRLLKVCYVPATSARLQRLLFLLQPLTELMKQTRQAVHAIKQSILLRCLW